MHRAESPLASKPLSISISPSTSDSPAMAMASKLSVLPGSRPALPAELQRSSYLRCRQNLSVSLSRAAAGSRSFPLNNRRQTFLSPPAPPKSDRSVTARFQLQAPLISPHDQWGNWTVLFATGAFGIWSEKNTNIGGALSGALVSTLIGLAASNLGVISSNAPAFSIVLEFLLPLAVPLLLYRADLRRVIKSTGALLLAFLLGSEILQSSAGIFVSQKKYALEVLKRFKMEDCNSVCTPIGVGLKLTKNGSGKKVNATLYKQMVGSLMYLTTTRPDIMFAVSMVSRYMEKPEEDHLLAVKRILRYLKGTADFGIFYKKFGNPSLVGFTDSDYAGDMDDRKSTSGFLFMMGSGAISWSAKKQQIVTLSTTEAEFVAAASSACQAIWLRRMLGVLQNQQLDPTVIYCDNSSTIKLSRNSVLHGRSKHIDVRYHFLRDLIKEGAIELVFCHSVDQVADIFTKALKSAAFVKLRGELGMCSWKEAVDYGVCTEEVSCWSFLCKLMS